MLKIVEKPVSPRRYLLAGQRVSKKYRVAQQNRLIKKREYKKLKSIVPAICSKNKVAKVTVIEEAIKYIDELHLALAKRMHLLKGIAPAYLTNQVSPHMLAPVFPYPANYVHPSMTSRSHSPMKPMMRTAPVSCYSNERHR